MQTSVKHHHYITLVQIIVNVDQNGALFFRLHLQHAVIRNQHQIDLVLQICFLQLLLQVNQKIIQIF